MAGCTFNLNTGLFGVKHSIGRIGDYGLIEKDDPSLDQKQSILVRYHRQHRIPRDEIAQVYDGFEVAAHSYCHEYLPKCSEETIIEAIRKDVETLREITRQDVVGFAYPYGATSDEVIDALKKNGIRYARTTKQSNGTNFQKDLFRIAPNCWIVDRNLEQKLQNYLKKESEEDQMFMIWGHGYELDFGTKNANWDKLRKLCDMIASDSNVICCTNREMLKL